MQVKATSSRRVAYDVEAREFGVFDETVEGVFHGHVRAWDELTQDMRNVLVRAGVVNRRGKPAG